MHISAQTKYHVALTEQEKTILSALIRKGTAKARVITRARVLLLASEGRKDREIYRSLLISYSTPHDVRKNYARGGLNRALYDAPRPGQARKLTGKQEAEEVTNKLGVSIGRTAIWHILLRNNLKPHRKKNVVYSHSNS